MIPQAQPENDHRLLGCDILSPKPFQPFCFRVIGGMEPLWPNLEEGRTFFRGEDPVIGRNVSAP